MNIIFDTYSLIFQNIHKVKEFVNHENSKVRIVIRVSRKVVYYLVIAMVAYITTRDQGDYYAESDLSNMETHVTPSFRYKLVWAFIVFLVLSMCLFVFKYVCIYFFVSIFWQSGTFWRRTTSRCIKKWNWTTTVVDATWHSRTPLGTELRSTGLKIHLDQATKPLLRDVPLY